MILKVNPAASLSGTVKVPPSKSYTHRAIILASLAGGRSTIDNPLISEDTLASIDACRKIGAGIEAKEGSIVIDGVKGVPKAPKEPIDVKNSGTTLRIMTPVSSLCAESVVLTGDDSIKKRPMKPLLEALEQLGVSTSSDGGLPPVGVRGPLRGGRCIIRGDISSQFISGLLIASPLVKEDTWIEVTSDIKSRPYVDMTLDALSKFGAEIERGTGFHVPGSQMYLPVRYEVEGDYSSAAIVLAAASLMESSVTISNLPQESRQGDRKIIDILRLFGVNVQLTGDSVTVRGGSDLDGIQIDLSDNPDLVPPVAVIGAFARGRTLIKNVEHLRFKECDRLKALSTELRKMGAQIRAGRDCLSIEGVDSLNGAKVHGWNDHRIVMCLAVAALRAEGETVIDTAEAIPVSFPGYVECMNALGAAMQMSR